MPALCAVSLCLVVAGCKTGATDQPSTGPNPNVVHQPSAPPATVPNTPLPQTQAAPPPPPGQPPPQAAAAGAAGAAAQPGAPADQAQLISPVAIQALERMGAYLRTLNTFEIEATTSTDEVVEPGLKVQLDGTVKMQVHRPNRLHMQIDSDRKKREFYFDGKNFTMVAPRLNFYSVTDAPPTLGELFDTLDAYDIDMPLADLFLWGTDRSPKDDVKLALPVGPATVDGTLTDQYLIGGEDVSWQVWIERGDKPLPRKMVITTLDVPQQPQHVTVMRWNTSPKLDESRFTFVPGKDAKRIPLRDPQAQQR